MEAAYMGFGFGIMVTLLVLIDKVAKLQNSVDEVKRLIDK
jgi:hypothetical protein